MTYGSLEWHKKQSDYWHERYKEANKKAGAAIAEAKKSKERELTAIRMMLRLKRFKKAIREISKAEKETQDYVVFGDNVMKILEEWEID